MSTPIFGAIQPLREGANVALVAPSGVLTNQADVDRAFDNVRSFGWVPTLGTHLSSKLGYLAGTDDDRLADLNTAFLDEDIAAVWCVRGGYGAMRLLAQLYYPAIRQNRKPLIGFSDVTALHCAIQRKCGLVTFHGPTARARLTSFSSASLRAALVDQRDSCGVAPEGRALRKGKTRGRLVGGNLALITSLIGTPFAPNFDDAILIIEDINEAVYRIDRMLRQLILSGSLQRCAAIVAGDFRPPVGESRTDNRTLDEVLTEAADHAGIPCLAGAPFGHIPDQWTIPLGAIAELDTGLKSLRVLGAD
ncbi:MAG TPA: LD-carboxypeptidase [Gemmatimonadaceae bacterium]|nr:LD-carboxypeptidase [Gemmatimonadaceae bacterium]